MPRAGKHALGALFFAALTLGAAPGFGQVPEHGFLLVAKPSIVDPNFDHTVILATRAPDGATLGVILNRPTKQSLADILPGNRTFAKFKAPLYFGGPVERVGLFAVFRAKESPGESFPVVDDVSLALHPAAVEQLLMNPPAQLRLFVGYTGWAPGQIDTELLRGDWWVLAADAQTVFRQDTETLWDELSRRAKAVTAHARSKINLALQSVR